MSHTLWTTLILYGAVQGIILASVVYVKNRSKYLALFFANIAYLLFIYLFERFEWFREYPHLIWTNVPSWFLIGPLLFLYVEQLFKSDESSFSLLTGFHFLPALGALIYLSDFYFGLSGPEKIAVFTSFYSENQIIDYVQMLYLAQIAVYIFAGHRVINSKTGAMGDGISNSDFIHLGMVRKMFVGIGGYIVLAIALSASLSLSFSNALPYFEIVFAALASTVFIATAFYLYHSTPPYQNALQSIGANTHTSPYMTDSTGIEDGSEKYATSSLSEEDKSAILGRLQEHMEQHQPYKRPDLKMVDLADEMNIPSHHISQCLNQQLGKNFFEFVNYYRVEAVKQQLREGRHQKLTLAAIAKECGFNSQSSFYRIFKDATGTTPTRFIDRHISN